MPSSFSKIIKDFVFPDRLNQIIFFVTSKCNSRCQHCFYWQELNRADDLTLEEIRKISKNLPSFSDLLLSGGEPFLREDLAEIVKCFFTNNKIKTINIPTNGLLKEKIINDTLKIADISPDLSVYINFSLDGLANIHNQIRGVPNGFEKTIDTLISLYRKTENKANVFLTINTVVNHYNFKNLSDLMDYANNLKIPKVLHYFEILRGSPKQTDFARKIPLEEYQNLYKKILNYQTKKISDFYKNKKWAFWKTKLAISHLKLFYKIQKDSYFNKRKWPMQCVSGKNIFVIDYNGDIKICELREKIINLKEIDYNLSNRDGIFKKSRQEIKKTNCYCTHSCFLYQGIHFSPKVIIFCFLPYLFLSLLIPIRGK